MKIRPEQSCSVWTERLRDIRISRRTDGRADRHVRANSHFSHVCERAK